MLKLIPTYLIVTTVLATATSEPAPDNPAASVERVCLAGEFLVTEARKSGIRDQAATQRKPTGTMHDHYWYGRWQGRLIPVPKFGGDVEKIIEHGHTDNIDVLSYKQDFAVGLSTSQFRVTGSTLDAMVTELGLSPSTRSNFAALKSGLRSKASEFSCDTNNVGKTVQHFDAMALRTNVVFHHADEIFIIGEEAILSRNARGQREAWRYLFPAPSDADVILSITLQANPALYPDLGFHILKAPDSYEPKKEEPAWLRDFIKRTETP